MEAALSAGVTFATTVATTAATTSLTRTMNFREIHELLKVKISELQARHDHVKGRITVDEGNGLTRTPVVSQWLDRVEGTYQEGILILEAGFRQIEQRCCAVGCYPHSWWACYRLGKKLSKMLMTVEELSSKGNFDIVADNSSPNPVQVLPESQTVGLDELFAEDEVKIMGIYGMGGVGKTTLLKKLNNAFCNEISKFDVVIWVVVSKESRIRNVHKQMGKRLGLEWNEEEDESERAQRIFNVLRKKKFVVMLDDIWRSVDLGEIGIPSPRVTQTNSKLVFTTRSEDVCGGMEYNIKIKVPVLDRDQSWILFQNKVGQEALKSHPEIPKLAEKVAEECGGLPLALIAIGRAMTSKTTPSEWKHAIKTLGKYAAEFSGMEENVLAILKFSYDNLENDIVKSCFIYFSLHPEDYNMNIMETIEYWIGEGFLDDCEDMEDAMEKGHDIIGSLKAACLLETSHGTELFVKMHDVVRDLALWIGRDCGKKKSKLLVQAGVGLTRIPNVESWKEAERISLMHNKFEEMPDTPDCPHLLTLQLHGNHQLSMIANDFFEHMPCLRVLNLCAASIEEVPKSIGCLLELQYLDVSHTRIKTLPQELGNLPKLRHLDLQMTKYLETIPLVSGISRLQLFDFYRSGRNVEDNLCGPSLEDLESLEHLMVLRITIQESSILRSILLSKKLSLCITKLCIFRCKGLSDLSLASSSSILRNLKKLYQLLIENCSEMEELEINSVSEVDNVRWLENLKFLGLITLPKLNISWRESYKLMQFNYLSRLSIQGCDLLKDLSWLALIPSLKQLDVHDCVLLEEILLVECTRTVIDNQTAFSRLEHLSLAGLPKLKSISRFEILLSCLEVIRVKECLLLKKLPFSPNSPKKPLLRIEGETEWWNALQWEDQTVKLSFQPFFKHND